MGVFFEIEFKLTSIYKQDIVVKSMVKSTINSIELILPIYVKFLNSCFFSNLGSCSG